MIADILGKEFYTYFKTKIQTVRLQNAGACVLIGLFLGLLSSFLGMVGVRINTTISETNVNKLFSGLMILIVGISIYNTLGFLLS